MNDYSNDRSKESGSSAPRYWYTSIAFVAAVVLSTLYTTSLIYLAGRAALQDGVVVVWLAGLGVLGVLTYPVLLKDTASVRDMGFMWQPKSWYYVLIGFGTPLATLILLGQRYPPAVRQLLTIVVFILVTCSVNVFYLYRRHRFLGTP